MPRRWQYSENRIALARIVSKLAPTRMASTVAAVAPSRDTAIENGSWSRRRPMRGDHTVPLVVTSQATGRSSPIRTAHTRSYSGMRKGSPPRKRTDSTERRKPGSWAKKSSP